MVPMMISSLMLKSERDAWLLGLQRLNAVGNEQVCAWRLRLYWAGNGTVMVC